MSNKGYLLLDMAR